MNKYNFSGLFVMLGWNKGYSVSIHNWNVGKMKNYRK